MPPSFAVNVASIILPKNISEYSYDVRGTITKVTANRYNHPGGAYGFHLERQGKVLVICTDIEHGDKIDPNAVALSKDADLLIHEAQYTSEELKTKDGNCVMRHSKLEEQMSLMSRAVVWMAVKQFHPRGETWIDRNF